MSRRILVLCTANSARSQMAEGLLRALGGSAVEVASAGLAPSRVHPLAQRVMAERGIDISSQRSKHVDEFRGQHFAVIITVCDQAAEQCPVFPGRAERLHWSFPDPAAVTGSEEEQLSAFRAVRDGLEQRIRSWLASWQEEAGKREQE
ncbi:arsenate reductase ArsC [Thermogemmatispora onikobensis]|uniref:arsenate reductase ArsC n=1 Tax=Thermogemmatispora onikobensis TaxID=732234 RepID=UPI000852F926|nr:arsenate reductase ArsC [Thermogemmatispora onikobensis]